MSQIRNAVLIGDASNLARVYARGRREQIADLTNLYPAILTAQDLTGDPKPFAGIDVIFSTWGMPCLTDSQLDSLPNLKAVFYAAGTVQPFARPLLERGITLVSAWHANAVAVAEFTLAQILLSTKGYWRNITANQSRAGWWHSTAPGNFGETVAILGVGAVGKAVVELLRSFQLKVIAFDPFLSDADAAQMGVEKVELEDAFARALVVSNHLANKPETEKMLGMTQFRAMRPGATFINTGRGATVDEPALIEVFGDDPSLTALLDVTDPEPPAADSPLFAMPNVHLTSHIAGVIGDEVLRMADLCIEEFEAWDSGKPLRYAITLPMLDRLA